MCPVCARTHAGHDSVMPAQAGIQYDSRPPAFLALPPHRTQSPPSSPSNACPSPGNHGQTSFHAAGFPEKKPGGEMKYCKLFINKHLQSAWSFFAWVQQDTSAIIRAWQANDTWTTLASRWVMARFYYETWVLFTINKRLILRLNVPAPKSGRDTNSFNARLIQGMDLRSVRLEQAHIIKPSGKPASCGEPDCESIGTSGLKYLERNRIAFLNEAIRFFAG